MTFEKTFISKYLDTIIIKDTGTIGSASDTDAIAISSAGVVSFSATTANTNATDGAVTIAGSPAAGEQVFFQIMRDVSADSQTGDARLLGIQIFFTTDLANDT